MRKLILLSLVLTGYLSWAQKIDSTNHTVNAYFILEKLVNEAGINNKEVKMMIVDFLPLSVSAAHRHPCPTFGYVLEGKIESVFEGKDYTYNKGDSFYEFANGLHSETRNPDKKNMAKLLVFYILDTGKQTSVRVH